MKTKNIVFIIIISYFSSNFKLFCCSDFSFFYIRENFLKSLFKQKYCILLLGFSVVIYSQKFFENMKTKILYLKQFKWFFKQFQAILSLGFPSEKFIKTKILFQGISSYFVTRIFCSYIFTKTFWKNYENKYYISNNLSDILKEIMKTIQVIHITYIIHILKFILNPVNFFLYI